MCAAIDQYSKNCDASVSALRVVIIGNGPVGMRVAAELLQQHSQIAITLIGDEPYAPYDRVRLSAMLAGDVRREAIYLQPLAPESSQQLFSVVARVHHIDADAKQLVDTEGQRYHYDKCFIATGSRAFVPTIPGNALDNVFTFRNLIDAERLYSKLMSVRSTVVVGGGLLGLEAAKGLHKYGNKVTIIQQGEFLMNRQLDAFAANKLQQSIQALGIDVLVNEGVRELVGDARVRAVKTRSGREIMADMVLFCTGITPNIDIAKRSGLHYGKGVQVNQFLQTSNPDIYAVGECCEYNGLTYGLVSPGFEQARVAVQHLSQHPARYAGSSLVARLKVVGTDVASFGEINYDAGRSRYREWIWRNTDQPEYRKLVLHKHRLIGAVSLGPWPDFSKTQHSFQQGDRIMPWQLLRFKWTGSLWRQGQQSVQAWPDSAVLCQCHAVTKGEIAKRCAQAGTTVAELSASTMAGTGCGSCLPLLTEMVGAKREKEQAWRPQLVLSAIAALLATVYLLMPEAKTADSVLQISWYERIWNDHFVKQVTGFSLLGLTVLGMLMSLRKRVAVISLGHFSKWRVLHILLGVLCVVTLGLHTGFHLGENLNRWLMLNFIAVVFMGSLAGVLVAGSHWFAAGNARLFRRRSTWLHVLVAWPLPVLLIFHILSVYYF